MLYGPPHVKTHRPIPSPIRSNHASVGIKELDPRIILRAILLRALFQRRDPVLQRNNLPNSITVKLFQHPSYVIPSHLMRVDPVEISRNVRYGLLFGYAANIYHESRNIIHRNPVDVRRTDGDAKD
ncbi:hypothetical protein MAJ_10477, partial [Metarhizium majus ARSEF 297]